MGVAHQTHPIFLILILFDFEDTEEISFLPPFLPFFLFPPPLFLSSPFSSALNKILTYKRVFIFIITNKIIKIKLFTGGRRDPPSDRRPPEEGGATSERNFRRKFWSRRTSSPQAWILAFLVKKR